MSDENSPPDWLHIGTVPDTPDLSDHDRAAIVTRNQFQALGHYAHSYMRKKDVLRAYASRLRSRPNPSKIDRVRVRSLCVNSWNTETLLRATQEQFTEPDQGFVVQWAFPQAYYSSFNSTLASFAVSGFTERSHQAVRRKVADIALSGGLPDGLNVYASGVKDSLQIHGIQTNGAEFQPMGLRIDDSDNVHAHIIAFARSTRGIFLNEKREAMANHFRTVRGQIKKSLSKADWQRVDRTLGPTSWLDLLYRKRIKANYRDIDTFLSSEFKPALVLGGLKDFMVAFNLINEINIIKNLGPDVRAWIPESAVKPKERIQYIIDEVI